MLTGGLAGTAHHRCSVVSGSKKADYVPCRVADWRVTFHEPADMKIGPEMPADAQWGRLVPVEVQVQARSSFLVISPRGGMISQRRGLLGSHMGSLRKES